MEQTILWCSIATLVVVAIHLTQGGFRTYPCAKCGGHRRTVQRALKKDGYEIYVCSLCDAGFVRMSGRKQLVSYTEWKLGDGLPEARVVSARCPGDGVNSVNRRGLT